MRLVRTCLELRLASLLVLSMLSACAGERQKTLLAPEQILALVQRADNEYQRGNLDAARRAYERLLLADSKYVPARVRLGVIAYKRSDFVKAQAEFETALALDPTNAKATYDLATLRMMQGHVLLERYLSLAPHADNRDRVNALADALDTFVKY